MKTIVLDSDLLELEIKPDTLLDEYRRLIAKDVKERFVEPDRLMSLACPGCHSELGAIVFEKFGLKYVECAVCGTVYVSPRPTEENIVDFYRSSKTAHFWRDRILPKTRDVRREKLYRPQARWLLDVVDRYRPGATIGLVLGYHNNLLIEELMHQEQDLFQMIVTNPIADIEYSGRDYAGVSLEPMMLDSLFPFDPVDLILAFDVLDRCADPEALFAAAYHILAPGGLILVSTTLSSGFDLQVLWERSESIYPPDRLNLLSVEGLTALFERHGFEALEFSTPGRFDVEIVQRALTEHPEGEWPRFIRYLITNRDKNALNALQDFLQAYRLSSFARLVLRKPA